MTIHPAVRRDSGAVAVEWALGIAVLLVPTLLLAGALPSWAARHEAAVAAAREAARHVVQSEDAATATALAHSAATTVLADRGVPLQAVRVDLPVATGRLPREGVVVVAVSVPGERLDLPGLGPVDLPAVTGRHARTLDPLRSR